MLKRSKIIGTATVLFCSLLGGPAVATPVLQGSTTAATGIVGLNVNGTLYDANFAHAGLSYNDAYSGGAPTFLNDLPGVDAATTAINAVLNADNVTGISGLVPAGSVRLMFLKIPFNFFFNPGLIPPQNAVDDRGPSFETDHSPRWNEAGFTSESVNVPPLPNETFVTFSLTPVNAAPEPATLLLLGFSLAGLGGITWRRHHHK